MLLNVISIVLTVLYAILMLYYLYGWLSLKEWKKKKSRLTTKITVVIPARNEADNILNCLNDLSKQSYPDELYEVLVVDDQSTDKTAKLVNEFQSDIVKLVSIDKKLLFSSKKSAIVKGIGQAKGDLIVTTDADCRMGKHWLSTIASFYEKYDPKMISAPVCYTGNTTLFKKFQALDFIGMVGIGAASISNNAPQVCNGANLAYKKQVFYEVDGFKDIDNIASGDDMLLMQKIAKQYPAGVKFLKNKDATVYTQANNTLKGFIQQRLRWASKSTRLVDNKVTIILGCVLLFNISIILNVILVFSGQRILDLLLFQLVIKYLADVLFLSFTSKFFRQIKLLWLFLPSQVLHTFYIVYIGIAANFSTYWWKERLVK